MAVQPAVRHIGYGVDFPLNCADGAKGRYVMITVMSNPGVKEYLHVCEIKVFVR